MSAVAGIASKVVSALPVASSIAKGAWNIGKKVVGGIKNIFTGGKAQEFVNQAQGLVDTGRQIWNKGQDLYQQGRDIYNGFRQGGFSGGIDAMRQRVPGMIDSGRQMFNQGQGLYQTGLDMYNTGRGMFNQGRRMIQGGVVEMQDMMRRRRGGMIRPAVMPG